MHARQVPGTNRLVTDRPDYQDLSRWNNRSVRVLDQRDRRGLLLAHVSRLNRTVEALAERAFLAFIAGRNNFVSSQLFHSFDQEIVLLMNQGNDLEIALLILAGERPRLARSPAVYENERIQPFRGTHGRALYAPPVGARGAVQRDFVGDRQIPGGRR